MLKDDVEMLMDHCRCSLSANGELLGAMIRIKKFIEEAQKTSNNTAQPAIALSDLAEILTVRLPPSAYSEIWEIIVQRQQQAGA